MSETTSKARAKEKKQARNKDTSKGIYTKVRSKFSNGPDGFGSVITLAREKALEANGGKLPKDSAVHHKKGSVAGANNTEDDNHWGVMTKGQNTAESNFRRGKRSKEYIRKKLGKNV